MIRTSWVRYLVLLSGLALVMTVLVTAMWRAAQESGEADEARGGTRTAS